MAKREKRLAKGIESLKEQKKIHEEKRKLADKINHKNDAPPHFERRGLTEALVFGDARKFILALKDNVFFENLRHNKELVECYEKEILKFEREMLKKKQKLDK